MNWIGLDWIGLDWIGLDWIEIKSKQVYNGWWSFGKPFKCRARGEALRNEARRLEGTGMLAAIGYGGSSSVPPSPTG